MKQKTDSLKQSYDTLAKLYDKETNTFHHKISLYLTIENLLLELPKNNNIKILDSGGGTGKYSIYLKNLGYDVTLSDISSSSIKIAIQKAKEVNIKLITKVCDSENTGFPGENFDVVMMNGGVISYTPHPEKLIKESYRILKPGGLLWFDFLNSLGWAIETVDPKQKIELALKDDILIQMPDWDCPARLMSLKSINELLKKNKFHIKSRYGLILLSNSLSLDKRYSKEYDQDLVKEYQKIELELSRRAECVGSSWSCLICAIKE